MADTATPITDRGLHWVDGVLAGLVPANRRVVLACERFKRDLKRADTDEFPFVFDPAAAEHLCAFVEAWPHTKGDFALRGETLCLSGWQAFALGQINGWRHRDTGMRRFRFVYIEVPRKNGKSTLVAPLGLYFLTVDGEPGAEVYSAASNTDQARIVFDQARAMALGGTLNGRPLSQVLGLVVEQHKIKTDDPAAVYRPVAAQTKSQDGKNPHLAILDELHEHRDRRVYDAMSLGMGSRSQPLLISITTAGWDLSGICYEVRRYVQRILDNLQQDEAYFGLIFEADEGDEPGDPKTWAKANPNLGVSKTIESMKDAWSMAQASAPSLGEFLRKQLNIWTSAGANAIDMDKWRKAEDAGMTLAQYAGRTAYIGVDLAYREDFASVVAAIPDSDNIRLFSWHFLPEDTVRKPGNEHYLGWQVEGHLITTPGAMLDLNVVEALVLQLAGLPGGADWTFEGITALNVVQVVADPTFAGQMAATWEAKGLEVVLLKSSAGNMHVPFQRLIGSVEDGRLISDGNPVLRWMASNTILKQVQGGDMTYPAKLSPEDKIDGITATNNALWPLSQVEEEDEGDFGEVVSGPVVIAL